MKTKQNKKKKVIVICVTIVIVFVIGRAILLNISKSNKEEKNTSSTTKLVETKVSTQTIQKTLTASGQIMTSAEENLSLTTSKYFSTMCVEEGDSVLEGENLLQYTDGTFLTAPYDLVVESYSVPTSGKICTSSNFIKVENAKTLNMKLSINESEIAQVKAGQNATITVNAVKDKTYTGTISKIDSIGTYSSSGSTFSVTIQFENDGNIKIGMSASCTVVLQEATDCIAVPIVAIQTNGNTKYVVVVKDNGETENVNVATGISNDSYVQILSGLDGSETIKMLEITSNSERSYRANSSTGGGMNGNRRNSNGQGGNFGGAPSGGNFGNSGNSRPSGNMQPGGAQ